MHEVDELRKIDITLQLTQMGGNGMDGNGNGFGGNGISGNGFEAEFLKLNFDNFLKDFNKE